MAATITAEMVKELREKTGAGMMECKKALTQSEGDFEGAVKILRESGAAKAAKREGRTAGEGLVDIAANADQTEAAMVELNCETDFVARNDEFQNILKALSAAALKAKANDVETLLNETLPKYGKTAREVVAELLAKIGEKITVSRVGYVKADYIATYIHPPGKIGTLIAVKLNGAKKDGEVTETLRNVAMHTAAKSPRFLHESEVDEATLASERDIAMNIARNEGKPDAILPKIVEGKIKSFYAENCLVNQEHVMHAKQSVKQVVDAAGKKAGGALEIVQFVRFKVGETAGPKQTEE